MADHSNQPDIDRQLEARLRAYRERIDYPPMGDSAASARARIEAAGLDRPPVPAQSVDPTGEWDEDPVNQPTSGVLLDFPGNATQSGLRSVLTLAAAALLVLVVGGALLVVVPNLGGDGEPSAGVLGPQTTDYFFAGTIGGSIIPNEPVSIALDAEGNIYAADIATRSIHTFDPDGQHRSSWSAEDADIGAFVRPWDIAVQGDTLYVLDQQLKAIYLLSLDGDVRDTWVIGDPFDPSDILSGMAVDVDGQVYVARPNDLRVAVYADDELVREIVVSDDPQRGEDWPADVAVADDGTVYVTGYSGNMLRAFDQEGQERARWENSEFTSQRQEGLYGISIAPSGDIYMSSAAGVVRLSPDGTVTGTWDVDTGPFRAQSTPNGSVAVDADGTIFFPDSSMHRIIAQSDQGDILMEIQDIRDDRLAFPGGLQVEGDTVYVAEILEQRVVAFDRDGTLKRTIPWSTQEPLLPAPGQTTSLTVSGDQIYILDGPNSALIGQSFDGEVSAEWSGALTGDDAWIRPTDLHLHPDGSVLILDDRQGRILRYSLDGEFLGEWAENMAGSEQALAFSMDIQAGFAYVSYVEGEQPGIWKLDLDGNPIERVVAFERGADALIETVPLGLAVADTGDIFTVDLSSRSVRWYAPDGSLRSEWPVDAGYEWAESFMDIAVDESGTVYVSDSDSRQILVYEPVE